MTDLLKLAERCEAATGPDFKIDCEIEALLFDRHSGMMRSFTASLDAAMTLVPEGFDWLVRNDDDRAFANVTAADFQSHITIYGSESFNTSTGFSAPVYAATPALALCAAALRARAAQ